MVRRPTTFRNTELCIHEELAQRIEGLGFDVLLGEGWDDLLGWRSAQHVYRPRGCERLKLLLRSYTFSDDIAFRFSNEEWPHHPLYADTFSTWLHEVPERAQFIGLFMDYETFGEHQWAETTGILEFMRYLPRHVLENERFSFQTPAELAASCEPIGELAIPKAVSWADQERDLTAWLGNLMQAEAHRELYAIAAEVYDAALAGHAGLLEDWRRLTTSDHVYYMCTKFFSDGDVHKYFSPYESPHEAYVRFTNVLGDLKSRLARVHCRSSALAEPDVALPRPSVTVQRDNQPTQPEKRNPTRPHKRKNQE